MSGQKNFERYVDAASLDPFSIPAIDAAITGWYRNKVGKRDGKTIRAVTALIRAGVLDFEVVVAKLGTSNRTLQRHMRAEGISFGELRDVLRAREALKLLSDADLPMTAVRERLQFTERTALHVAVGRWFGVSPGRLRDLLLLANFAIL